MAKRRLKSTHKVELFKLATEKFVDAKLREAEDEAGAKLAASLVADWKRELGPHVSFLEKTGDICTIKSFSIPSDIPVLSKEKGFERPDGVAVVRKPKTVLLEAALERTMEYDLDTITKFVLGGEDRPQINSGWRGGYGRKLARKVDLPEPLFYSLSDIALHYDKTQDDKPEYFFRVTQRTTDWVSKKTIDLIRPLIEAGHSRANAENILWRVIGKVIFSSATFEQVLEFWPEASLIEGKLFPVKEPLNALVPLSAEEKSILCNNMSDRGIQAAICQVAA